MQGGMTMNRSMKTGAALSAAVFAMMLAGTAVDARKVPQDVAGKLSGTWVLNRDLSSGFGKPAPGRGRGAAPSPWPQRPGALFAMAGAPQRGGGGGRGGGAPSDATDLTPEQRAEQAAMKQLQLLDERLTIKASADTVIFVDSRGERTFTVNDKTSSLDVGGSSVKVKSKWDKKVLKQEFSNSQAKLTQTWGLDETDHLVLTAKIESMTLLTPERKAVFDRQ
jgi:hypothetical protein